MESGACSSSFFTTGPPPGFMEWQRGESRDIEAVFDTHTSKPSSSDAVSVNAKEQR